MEGAIVFASLIVGVAVTDQMTSLHRLLRAREKVRWDPLPLLFFFFVVLTVIMTWWAIAGQRQDSITIGEFLPSFVSLVLIFLLAHASLPDEGDPDQYDLRAFWDRQGRYLWGVLTLAVGFDLGGRLIEAMVAGRSLADFYQARDADIVMFGVLLLVFLVRRRWLDWIVVILLSIVPLAWMGRSLS